MQTINQLKIELDPKTNQEQIQQQIVPYLKTLQEATEGVSFHECSFDADSGNEEVDRLFFVEACHFFAHHPHIDDLIFFMEVGSSYLAHQSLELQVKQLLETNNRLRHFGYYQSTESISDEALTAISSGLITNKSLTKLSICHLPPDEDDDELVQEPNFAVQYLPLALALTANSTLLHLNLERGGIQERSAYFLACAFAHNTTLTTINIARNGMTEADLTTIVNSLMANAALTSLNLKGQRFCSNKIEEAASLTKSLGELICRVGLRHLNLNQLPLGSVLGNLIFPILLCALAPRGFSLLNLHLESMIIDDVNITLLINLLNLNRIQGVFLLHAKMNSASYIFLLRAIENNTALSSMTLTESKEDADHLGPFLARMVANNRSLTNLGVAFKKLTTEKWLRLIDALKFNPTLTSLELYNCEFQEIRRRAMLIADMKELFEHNHSLCHVRGEISTTEIKNKVYRDALTRNISSEQTKFLKNFLKTLVRFTIEGDKKGYEERALMPYFQARSLPIIFSLLPNEFPNRVHTKQAQDCILRFQNQIEGTQTRTPHLGAKRRLRPAPQ